MSELTLPSPPPEEPFQPGSPGLTRRQWVGLWLCPFAYALCQLGPIAALMTPDMRAVAGLTLVMAILWVCESVPLAATALLPLVLLPVFGVAKPGEVAGAYANDMIFLFIGGFVLANGVEHWGLHRRLARAVLAVAGTGQRALVGGLMAATAFISMWISNTATALLMMPVGLSLARLVGPDDRRFAAAVVLAISTAASIGGMGTPIGSTPNLLFVSLTTQMGQGSVDFGRWMLMGVPLVLVFSLFAWWLLTFAVFPLGQAQVPRERDEAPIGPWCFGEVLVAGVFAVTALSWVFREPKTVMGLTFGLNQIWPSLSDGTIAIAGALALFLVPVSFRPGRFALDWQTGGRIPWDVILLFGGGLALADGIQRSGLDKLMIQGLGGLQGLPNWSLLVLVCAVCVVLSELASNTAAAALLLPLGATLAVSMGQAPIFLMLPITLATSLGFMLPAATPPNALALASGYVTVGQMAWVGLWLNVVGLALVIAACYLLGFPVLGK